MPSPRGHAAFRVYATWVLDYVDDPGAKPTDLLAHCVFNCSAFAVGVSDAQCFDSMIDDALCHGAIAIALTGDLHDLTRIDAVDMEYVFESTRCGARTAIYDAERQLLYTKAEMDAIRADLFRAVNRGDCYDAVADLAARHLYPLSISTTARRVSRDARPESVAAMFAHARTFDVHDPSCVLRELARYHSPSLTQGLVFMLGAGAFSSIRVDSDVMDRKQREIVKTALMS